MSMIPGTSSHPDSGSDPAFDAETNIDGDVQQNLDDSVTGTNDDVSRLQDVQRMLSGNLGDKFVCINGRLSYRVSENYRDSLVMEVDTQTFRCLSNDNILAVSDASPETLTTAIAQLGNFATSTLARSSVGAYFWYYRWWRHALCTDLEIRNGLVQSKEHPDTPIELSKLVCDIGSAKSDLARLNNQLNFDLRTKTDELKKAKRNLGDARHALDKTRSKLNEAQQRLRKEQGAKNRVQQELRSTENQLTSANTSLVSLREENRRTLAAYGQKLTKVTAENARLEEENGRWFDELDVARRENQKMGGMERTFDEMGRKIDELRKAKNQLLHENSVLRDKLSDMRGGSRRVASMFWTKDEVVNAFVEIKKQRHYDLLVALEDLTSMDLSRIHEVLWEILFAVGQKCHEMFADVEKVLSIGENGPFRNEMMTKIRDYFEQVLRVEEIIDAIKSQFEGAIGDMVRDERFEKYVNECAKLCWVLAMKDDPKMRFDWEARNLIGKEFMKADFDANFELDCPDSAHNKARCLRVVQFVLPGLREMETSIFVVPPCVVADVVEVDDYDANPSPMEVDGKTEDEGDVASAVDGNPNEDASGSAAKNLEDEREKISKMLGEGAVEEAFLVLKACGFDMESGEWAMQLTCGECESDLGILREADDSFMCETDIRHDEVTFEMVATRE